MTAIFGVVRDDDGDAFPATQRLEQALRRFGPHRTIISGGGAAYVGRHLWHLLPEDGLPDTLPALGDLRYLVVCDVRLTERDSLAAQLDVANPSAFSDSALVAGALERWDERAFERIYGSFAIAAWDKQRRRLLLARDHLGYRPLLYHVADRRLAFSSMPQGLHALDDVPRGPDPEAMRRHLRVLQPEGDRTFFQDIRRVQPGHYAIATASSIEQHRYWKPDLTAIRRLKHDAFEREFATRWECAVEASLRGEYQALGCHLSSGYDSTAVTVTAARLLKRRGRKVIAFTGVPRDGFRVPMSETALDDESAIAALNAHRYSNVEHVTVQPLPRLEAYLEHTISDYGVPILNMCNAGWIEAINREARDRGITVLLEGSMGNATISETGTVALSELLRSGRLRAWFRIARGLVRHRHMGVSRVLWNSASPFLSDSLWHRLRSIAGRHTLTAARASALKAKHWAATSRQSRRYNARLHPLDRSYDNEFGRDMKTGLDVRTMILSSDNGMYLKSTLALWGLDVRDPTGDRRLAEFSLRVPIEHLIWEGQPRALLRNFLRNYVAPEMLENRKVGRQAADWALGMTTSVEELRAQIDRIADFAPSDELIDVERLRALADEWPRIVAQGRTNEVSVVADYRLSLIRALAAATFMRRAAGSNI